MTTGEGAVVQFPGDGSGPELPNDPERPDDGVVAEQVLVRQARAGDPVALAELCRRSWRPVYRSVARFADGPADAEDLTQEVFLRALRSLPRFDARGLPFNAYLLRIAQNLVHDRWRRGRSRTVVDDDLSNRASTAPGPDLLVVEDDRRQRLLAGLDQLDADHYEVLRLRVVEGRATREVAELMARSPVAVRQLQVRALAALRDALGAEWMADERRRETVGGTAPGNPRQGAETREKATMGGDDDDR